MASPHTVSLRRAARFIYPFFFFALLIFTMPNALAQNTNRLTAEGFLDFTFVQAPQISPDGKQVVYTRRVPDKINDRYENELWIINTDGTRHRFFARGGGAQWSADGKAIAYIANGQPTGSQIFVKYVDTAEETQITRLERSPSNLAWSPDGKRIAFNMIVPAENSFTVKLPAKPSGAKWVDPPRAVNRLDYRADGSGYRTDGFMHIFVVAADGGTARHLTSGDFNHSAPEWSMDNRSLVFSAERQTDAEYLRFGSEIYKLDLDTRRIIALTDRKGVDQNPTVSPDGKFIAYTGYDESNNTYTISKLYVMNADGTLKRVLTQGFDRSPTGLMWSPDSSGIYFTTEDKGTNNLYLMATKNDAAPKQITSGTHQLFTTSISRDNIAVGTMTNSQSPMDVVVFNTGAPRKSFLGDVGSPRRLTTINGDLLMGRKLGDVEEINYPSVGGMNVQGWVVKPPDFDATKKYPLMLYIHGGPHAMYGVGFNYEFQLHAANGYVVLYTNPRGSTGYGQTFGNAINNAYPGEDYNDLMNGVDEVIKRGYIDERNLFVCGGSGGGVLTTWIVGHTDRFAAAVAMKPVVNWYSFVGTTDSFGWYYNFKNLPWMNPEEHIKRSPITYVGNVKTPTMLLTGDLDLRTPLEQTEQYYRALKLLKVPTMMVRLTDEYHGINADFGLRHPSNRLQQMLYLRAWFDKYRKQ